MNITNMNNRNTAIIFTFMFVAILAGVGWYYFAIQKGVKETPTVSEEHPSPPTQATTTPETKLYRNEEWGFEFEYPEGWKVKENSVRTSSSKFNLTLSPLEGPYQPNPPILFNIVTSDFGDYTFQNLDKVISEINIDGIIGERYDYKLGNMQRISILLPFDDLRIIFGAGKGYEDTFNQIIASFKFLK